MGFTFSHPALILPARYFPRESYSINGLVVGSMIPDLEYFIRLDNLSTFSHTLWGLFLFDLPAALIVLTIYHQLVRNSLIKNLPDFLKLRFSTTLDFNWPAYLKKEWKVVVYSILIGSLTHLVWDGFTSGNGYFVNQLAAFEKPFTIFNITLFTYKLIKHSSSFVGALLLLYVLFKLPVKKRGPEGINPYYWVYLFVFTTIVVAIQLVTYYQHISMNQLIKKIVSSNLLSFVIVSMYYRFRSKMGDTSG